MFALDDYPLWTLYEIMEYHHEQRHATRFRYCTDYPCADWKRMNVR
jgi:hypothetical protein